MKYTLNITEPASEQLFVRTMDGDIVVEFGPRIAPLRIKARGLTKEQYADKIRSYALPNETVSFSTDNKITVTRRTI